MKNKQTIWVGTDQLNTHPDYVASEQQEFQQQETAFGDISLEASRRDFLKYLGFGIGAATITACDIPVRRAIPYVVKPDTIVPGVATYYASTFVEGGDYCPVLVKTREGRPIKVEGNSFSSVTRGGTSARAQASVLSMYDTSRYDGPYRMAKGRIEKPRGGNLGPGWDEIDRELMGKLQPDSRIRILSHTILSPSTKRAIQDFKATFTRTVLVQYDPVSSSALLAANAQSFGVRAIPSYRFDRAKVIVAIDCDFLGTWISPVEYAGQYAEMRRIRDAKQPQLSRHIQIESHMSLTGSNADNRIMVKPSEQGMAILALYNEIVGGGNRATLPAATLTKIKRVANELKASQGAALVVSGSNNTAEQVLVNAINNALGSYGSTIDLGRISYQRQGNDADLKRLTDEMNSGQVDAVIVIGSANPAFDTPYAARFVAGMEKVKTRISCASIPNETLLLCDYITPTHHYLESWSDAEPKQGIYSLIQPTITPIFASVGRHGTRQAEASLLVWSQSPRYDATAEQPYLEYVKSNWQQTVFKGQSEFATFQAFWDSALHDGVYETTASGNVTNYGLGYNEGAAPRLAALPRPKPVETDTATTTGIAPSSAATDTVSRPAPLTNTESVPVTVDSVVRQERRTVAAAPAPLSSQPTGPAFTAPSASFQGDGGAAAGQVRKPAGTDLEIAFFETVNMGGGQYAANPWLQEMPDPVTRCVWGNYLTIPVTWDGGTEWGAFKGLNAEEFKGKADRVEVSIGERQAACTVVRQFGQLDGTVGLALGYGREVTGIAGRATADDIGVNVFPWLPIDGDGHVQYYATDVAVGDKIGVDKEFACVQYHHTMGVTAREDGKVVVDEETGRPLNVDERNVMTLGAGYQGGLVDRSIIYQGHLSELGELTEHIAEKRAEAKKLNSYTLYPYDEYKDELYSHGFWWTMHVDLNACIGCGACQVACVAENNVPVVGRKEVHRHHEMTWLRIDRYFYGDYENPRTVYQPMMCQHCDNAPCENVCPVNATNHSEEGLNQMTYNRCIGTRYCANNCPYKVRRFNWLDYTTADLFAANEPELTGATEELPYGADNLTRMVLNPDVTVRSRGVIEKCSFCVQRIQQGKLAAKVEGRRLVDSDVRTACQTACPTGAIVFGNRNNQQGEVAQRLEDPLNYLVLEETNTQPSVFYSARVNNSLEELEA